MANIVITKTFWSDVADSLVIGARGDLVTVINEDSVRNSIRNILGVSKGEVPFFCRFGNGLQDLVFENINESLLNRLADAIKVAIEQWEPRVIITGIDIKADDDRNQVVVTSRFQIRGYEEVFTETTNLNPA